MTVSFGDKNTYRQVLKIIMLHNKGKSEQSYKLNEILNVNINYRCMKNTCQIQQINSLPR